MFFKKLLFAVMLVVLSIAMVSYAQDEKAEETVLFIGTVTGVPDEFVGLAMTGEDVTIYICDGQPDKGTISIAQWFVGKVKDNVVDITAANGNRVQATIAADSSTGKFTFKDGSTKDFTLTLAEGDAALLRSDFKFGDEEFVLGWLVLPDGSVRGGGFKKSSEQLVPASLVGLDLAKKVGE